MSKRTLQMFSLQCFPDQGENMKMLTSTHGMNTSKFLGILELHKVYEPAFFKINVTSSVSYHTTEDI